MKESSMGNVQWSDNLSIGVDVIDEQHKALIQRLNDLHTAITSHQGQSAIAGTLNFLIEYTHFHFDAEEKYMAASNYPGLNQQVAEHNEFRESLDNIERDFKEDGATHELAAAIDTLLINWLIEHIQTTDINFGKYLSDNNITLSA